MNKADEALGAFFLDLAAVFEKHHAKLAGNAQTYYPTYCLMVGDVPVYSVVATGRGAMYRKEPDDDYLAPNWPPKWEDEALYAEPDAGWPQEHGLAS